MLEGLNVIELGAGSIGGAIAGMLLADAGAHVLKLEPPDGDRLRRENPSGFLAWNRGKSSVVADLRSEAGRETARTLSRNTDVVIDALAPGTADAWGLGYEELSQNDPSIIYCSITAFGRGGPYAALKGYEGVFGAKVGLFGLPWTFRDGPKYVNAACGSLGAGHLAHAGIVAALMVRDKTGRGQRVDTSLVQGLQPFDYHGTMRWQHSQRNLGKTPSSQTVVAERYRLRTCSQDGQWVVHSTMLTHQCHAFLRAMEMTYLLEDQRFAQAPRFASADDAQDYEQFVMWTFAQRTLEDWMPRLLAEADLPFEVMVSAEMGLDHPQIRANGNVVTVADDRVGMVEEVGPVAAFSRTPLRIERSAPALGSCRATAERQPSTGDAALPAHPLSGVTIVELGYFYAMPFALTLAASLGARVIKVEDLHGDPMRWGWGAREVAGAKTTEGKESIAVDLGTPDGRAIMAALLEKADVFAQGFRPGVAERLGVDYRTVAQSNGNLLYLHATGYGPAGPYSNRPLYAGAVAGPSGAFHRQSAYWLDQARSAGADLEELWQISDHIQVVDAGDAVAALGVLSALMLGLRERAITGEGQLIETTMVGTNAYAFADDFIRYNGKPSLATPDPEMFGLHALYRLYQTEKGWIFLAAIREEEWRSLVRLVDDEDLLSDVRFASAAERTLHDAALVDKLQAIFAKRPGAEWEQRLNAVGVGCALVFDGTMSEFTSTDPVLRANELVAEVVHPLFGRVIRHGIPIHFSATPGRIAPGCLHGQHTRTLLAELGYAPDGIGGLVERGVVYAPGLTEP
jgi:crotonobetainyl-CoA:carnitine CoA-transferase CaiB-like acyl-CoA transferase